MAIRAKCSEVVPLTETLRVDWEEISSFFDYALTGWWFGYEVNWAKKAWDVLEAQRLTAKGSRMKMHSGDG